MVKSLRGLRLSLPGLPIAGGGERIILDIFFLAISEFYRQNCDVMRMHLKMIRRLVHCWASFLAFANMSAAKGILSSQI
jgi:hypothetical protein